MKLLIFNFAPFGIILGIFHGGGLGRDPRILQN